MIGAFVAGCVLEPVPIDGLACPCAAPYVCDEAASRCVERLVTVCGRARVSAGSIDLSTFERSWVTPEQAGVRWALEDPSVVSELQIDLAASATAMDEGDFETIDGEVNPELGRPFLLRTSGSDPVLSTVLRDLAPDTAYAVRLVVIDRGGRVSCSDDVPLRTNLAPTDAIELFEESLPPGARLRPICTGSTLAIDPATAHEGEASIAHTFLCARAGDATTSVCTEPAELGAECWENVGFESASIDAQRLSAGDFDSAFVEVAVAIDDTSTAFWSEADLRVGADLYRISRFTLVADGTYHRYQLPLSALRRACYDDPPGCTWNEPLALAALSESIGGFRVGTTLSHGARLSVDSIFLRW
ncbi:MAG: hypothetical protein M3Y87_12300 [Myxococcota bacterium]|nr:hypothetical protein [Myxococcota bacterium]